MSQTNNSNITNIVNTVTNTGYNTASGNTESNVSIASGPATSNVKIINNGNTNTLINTGCNTCGSGTLVPTTSYYVYPVIYTQPAVQGTNCNTAAITPAYYPRYYYPRNYRYSSFQNAMTYPLRYYIVKYVPLYYASSCNHGTGYYPCCYNSNYYSCCQPIAYSCN